MSAEEQEPVEHRPVRLKMAEWEETPDSGSHPIMIVSFDGIDTKCCAYSWCTGTCGFPAAVITSPAAKEHKLYGSMVACGDVVQRWRGKWTGKKLIIPSMYWEFLSRRVWL